ncbi:cordon-bleu protein-like 1 isoform X2 [Anolis carolinensis]|uniref:cordon-bleu protein-like 1 isoform X2 n=1 Tax=Anolis carolinensis TaxID=28377 RepID=UPI002F2B70E7
MDSQACAASTRLPPSGRKAKPKAPLPPPEKRIADCSFDDSELTNYTMEQKENIIDRDIELSVVLPGDVIKSTTVNGSKPMMDLLVYLCAQYRLNPSSHTIDLVSVDKKQIKFKPNTPIGMLEVDKVILKPKQMDKKKPTPVVPEQTVRVVVNYKKTQKTIVRVSPHVPLQDLLPIICSKCDFDPLHTVLLKTYQSSETLDLTKSLNVHGLRELYAMDISRSTPTTEFSFSLQDCQNSQNSDVLREKENKGFFSFFQRNKKKREQTASAPATPLMSKPRPTFITKPNTISKHYESSTLPSEMPKKRRAPLPPMPASQSVPQDLAQTQDRPATCVVKSSSVDETDKGLSGIGIVRTGSLQLSGTSSVNSSLRRAKRKAPTPPPRKLQAQSDNSIETGSESAESVHTEGRERYSEVPSPSGNVVDLTRTAVPSGFSEPTSHDQSNIQQVPDEAEIGSEYSLEEIDEKEEIHEESTDTSLTEREVSTSISSPNVQLDIQKNETIPMVSDSGTGAEAKRQDSKEEKIESMRADDKDGYNHKPKEKSTDDNGKLYGSCRCDATSLPTMTDERQYDVVGVRENKTLEVLNCETCQDDTSLNQEHNMQALLRTHEQKWDCSSVETVKTQDVAIQATPSDNNVDQSALSKSMDPQGYKLVSHKDSTHIQTSVVPNQSPGLLNRTQETVGTLTEQSYQKHQAVQCRASSNGDQSHTLENDDSVPTQRVVKSPVSSPTVGYPLYRQDSKPKPKPSNEITRDYIPKIGMTTYKIVPPKSLEIVKNWESNTIDNQEASSFRVSPKNENSQEFGTQTEILDTIRSPNETRSGFRNEVRLPANDPPAKTYGIVDNVTLSFSNAKGKKVEAEHSKPNPEHLIAPLVLSAESKSCSPPAVREKPIILSPPAKPNNFYLQMQRRISSHYVTSAIARSSSPSTSTQSEAKTMETEKKLASPDQNSFPFPQLVSVPSQLVEEKTENGHVEEKPEVSSSAILMQKPLNSPPSQPPPVNLKTLRTFVLPQPYSSSRPSPFALAVSSAVKRSQSFSKTYNTAPRPLKEHPALDRPSSMFNPEMKDHSPLPSPTEPTQQNVPEKENNCASYEQSRQVPSLPGHPTTLACEKGPTVTLPRPDPEQIHQSLLAAIRSGEAVAKLRRVAPPSNTVAINGRSSLSSLPIEARYSHH